MEALEFPDLGHLSPVRGFSASPLQSLVLWNNHFMLHFAEKFAAHVRTTGSTSQQHVVAAIRNCWLREPTMEELTVLEELSSSGGLTSVCRALLNSNEFLFVD
jgi:hypothetical protein